MGDQSSHGERARSSSAGGGLGVALRKWLIRVDTGGTFTDGWARSPDGQEHRCKVLSSGAIRSTVIEHVSVNTIRLAHDMGIDSQTLVGFWAGELKVSSWNASRCELSFEQDHFFESGDVVELTSREEAPLLAARILTQTSLSSNFPEMEVRVATTRATNALLERKGSEGVLLITSGFEDLLRIRDQRRPELFALEQFLNEPLFETVIGVHGRISAHGEELCSLEFESIKEDLLELRQRGVKVAAVALLNSYADNTHELALGALLDELGFEWISLSHRLSESMRLLTRAETAVVNAYLSPIMRRFVGRLEVGFGKQALTMMTSAGYLQPAGDFRPIDSLLSGPAGGAVGALAAGQAAGMSKVLAFDMGGTSTDVCRLEGKLPFRYEQDISGVKVLAPSVRIETVAAGGGSICHWRLGTLGVGPESAGADPGPACYGRGGPLTVTDVNLLLGYMDADKAGIPLSKNAASVAFEKLKTEMRSDGVVVDDDKNLLEGIREIAVEKMADAIRTISLREGADPSDYSLVAFGGAGPQHACSVAEKLGMTEVLVPGQAGILSAWGLHCAVRESLSVRQLLRKMTELGSVWYHLLSELSEEALSSLDGEADVSRVLVEVRLLGQDSTIEIESTRVPSLEEVANDFAHQYRNLYGYSVPESREIEIVTVRVVAAEFGREFLEENFEPGVEFALGGVLQDHLSTCVIAPGWQLSRGDAGSLCLRRNEGTEARSTVTGVVEEELYRCRFERVVEEMGELLRRTALSTNVKERLDYSCALLDRKGCLVVNAPHIPVHLGALGLCVRTVSEQRVWQEGDMVVVNHPGYGGSHLPDVTVISPVFHEGTVVAFVANRAHHAEIGGLTPGSMPAVARCLAEEGVVIPPTCLFVEGEECFGAVRKVFEEAEYPSRMINDNMADLAAQAAANLHGVEAVKQLMREGGAERMSQQMRVLYERAHQFLSARIRSLPTQELRADDTMDDGTPVCVHLRKTDDRLIVNFEGSGSVHAGNLNATSAVVRSAVLYVLRLWVDEDVPLNEGLLDSVEIEVPFGFLNPEFPQDPNKCPAVVGGNVETSQRVVDVLLKALDLQANGQGTMNNVLFGNDRFGYYETIGGGGGAGAGWNGLSGCHVHMSNTAITDPEVLEHRFPIRLHEFSLRKNSGGTGKWNGGEGLVREWEFLEPMTVSLLTQRRLKQPCGFGGGDGGLSGGQWLLHHNGKKKMLDSVTSFDVEAGTKLRLETPGGGGWGVQTKEVDR